MTDSINEFYSYSIEDLTIHGSNEECFQVIGYDENQVSFVICTTKTEKIAQHLIDSFDCLAMDEEKELFKEIQGIENESTDIDDCCLGCGTKDLPCFCDKIQAFRAYKKGVKN